MLIQAGLRVSLEKFTKICEIVQTKAKKKGLGNEMLETNQIREELDNLVEKIRKKVEKHIKNNNRI